MVEIQSLTELPLADIADFGSHGVASAELGAAAGRGFCHYLQFAAGSAIGPHPTGFHQRFVVLAGSGWVAGGDGVRQPIAAGEYATFHPGEMHAKGSDDGMQVLMVQLGGRL